MNKEDQASVIDLEKVNKLDKIRAAASYQTKEENPLRGDNAFINLMQYRREIAKRIINDDSSNTKELESIYDECDNDIKQLLAL